MSDGLCWHAHTLPHLYLVYAHELTVACSTFRDPHANSTYSKAHTNTVPLLYTHPYASTFAHQVISKNILTQLPLTSAKARVVTSKPTFSVIGRKQPSRSHRWRTSKVKGFLAFMSVGVMDHRRYRKTSGDSAPECSSCGVCDNSGQLVEALW